MKNKHLLLYAIIFLFFSFKPAETVNWKLDVNHSGLGFTVLHLNISDFKGTIKMTKGTVSTPNADFTDATINVEADMNSIDTDNDKRDAHLKSADFFDAEKFPTITFQSTSCKKGEGDSYNVSGTLTMHGVTHPINLIANFKTGTNPSNDKPITGCKVTGVIKRTDFNVAKDTPLPILSDDVRIEGNLEFSKEQP